MPDFRLYSSACFIMPESMTGAPSSLKATAPATASLSISTSSCPFLSLVIQPMGRTRTTPSFRASIFKYSSVPVLSVGGSVLGMAHTVVKPPRAAASVPVAMVSLSSKPGCRRWQ